MSVISFAEEAAHRLHLEGLARIIHDIGTDTEREAALEKVRQYIANDMTTYQIAKDLAKVRNVPLEWRDRTFYMKDTTFNFNLPRSYTITANDYQRLLEEAVENNERPNAA